MPTQLNYLKKPKLKKPTLVAGLPGIAHIGKLAVEYMIHELRAENFAELYSEYFPEWVVREDGLIKSLKVDFYHCRPDGMSTDIILATADAQAASPVGQYALSDDILNVAVQHDVDTVATMAAYMLSTQESRSPVVGAATDSKTSKLLRDHNIELLEDGMIVGMNGLLVGLAAERNLHGFCLLGATEGGLLDIRATEAVLKVLADLLGFKLNLKNLQKYTPAISKLKQPKFKLPSAVEEEVSYIR
jgi:uncharacterized protein (TIGR00162 family)